ncbi:MAG: 1-acyl-sn-glycerol-3-phosphate acyltransferase [Deltaproteobacteria bacterium]|nr:1-acyl-sn-glycerol-3-phosphate acyltransferase [Deltaproteobacteria bacterium]
MIIFRTVAVWVLGIISTVTAFLFIALVWPFDRRGALKHYFCVLWARSIIAVSGVKVSVTGLENVPRDRAVLFLSNHQGAFDIPAIQSVLPVHFLWVAKKSLFKVPVVGWSMSLTGYISIDRDNPAEAVKSMEEASGRMGEGISVVIFPEGTRSETGALLPFKRGAFMLAKKSGVPIVPVAIQGTNRIKKKGSFLVNPAKVRISIGRPIPIGASDEKELRNMTKRQIEEMIAAPGVLS